MMVMRWIACGYPVMIAYMKKIDDPERKTTC